MAAGLAEQLLLVLQPHASQLVYSPNQIHFRPLSARISSSASSPNLSSRFLKASNTNKFVAAPLRAARPSARNGAVLCSAAGGKKEQKWTDEGSVTESLPNGMFRVQLTNGDVILGYVSGKIRKNFVRILPGDKVKVEMSRYDSTRGRIIYRLRSKDPKD